MPATIVGRIAWGGERNEKGHRIYKVVHRVVLSNNLEGPATVMSAAGLPSAGTAWNFGLDSDSWAFCKLAMSIRPASPLSDKEPLLHWDVEQTFSSESDSRSCKDEDVDNPLLQPQEVSGSFVRSREPATHDRWGLPIINSAFERIPSPEVDFDVSKPTVRISQNVASLQLALLNRMKDTVNDRELWGIPRRGVKLSGISWDVKYYGACLKYYTRTFDFEIDVFQDPETEEVRSGHDRRISDWGTKVLSGKWEREGDDTETSGCVQPNGWVLKPICGSDPDPYNPTHYIQAVDRNGHPTRLLLDGLGKPWVPDLDTASQWWCVNNGVDVAECFEGTCAQAREFAAERDARFTGPYASESECGGGCSMSEPIEEDYECPYSEKGIVYVEKYQESNFALLNIPTTF